MDCGLLLGSLCEDAAGLLDQIRLDQTRADVTSLSGDKGVGHSATHDDVISGIEQLFEQQDFVADFRSTCDRYEWAFWVVEQLCAGGQFFGHKQARGLVCVVEKRSHGSCRAVRSVCCSEGIVDVDAPELTHALSELLITLLLAGLKAGILDHQHFTGAKLLRELQSMLTRYIVGYFHL